MIKGKPFRINVQEDEAGNMYIVAEESQVEKPQTVSITLNTNLALWVKKKFTWDGKLDFETMLKCV